MPTEPTKTGEMVEPLRVLACRTANGHGNDNRQHVLLRLKGEGGWGQWHALPVEMAESLIDSLVESVKGCDHEQALDN